jgi:DNA-binding response OmpR family regulator
MKISGHILLIDDEPSVRKTLARILQQAGFEVTTAESGEQGLAFLEGAEFDLVYMDLRMPGLTGLDVLNLLHTHHPTLPVVLFTAQPDVNSAVEALRRGASDYLLKPLKPEIIIERTKVILASQQKERRKREIAAQMEALQAELKNIEMGEDIEIIPAQASPSSERFIKRGPISLDLHTHRVVVGERSVAMAPTSFDYLLVLMRHAPDVVDFQTLVAEAQGYQADLREAQELTKWHIHQIRQVVEENAHTPLRLITVRGMGYRLVFD